MVTSENAEKKKPKKKKYSYWSGKGQQGRLISCLCMGDYIQKEIAQIIGSGKAGWISDIIGELIEKGYAEERLIFNKKKNRKIWTYFLIIEYFTDYAKKECKIKFNKKEIKWLREKFEKRRHNICSSSVFDYRGSLIKGFLDNINYEILQVKSDFLKVEGEFKFIKNKFLRNLSKKILGMMLHEPFLPNFHPVLLRLENNLENYYYEKKDDSLENFIIKHLNRVDYKGESINKEENKKFFLKLTKLNKFPIKKRVLKKMSV